MKHAQFTIEIRKQGALILRSEKSDCVEMTLAKARTLRAALDSTFMVVIMRDGVSVHVYEWDNLGK